MLLGSTQKMGAGTNVQDKLVAVHHLDVGWRPSDMTEENGRIIRRNNQTTRQPATRQSGLPGTEYGVEDVEAVISRYTTGKGSLGMFGEPRVNVLKVNLALDGLI